MGIPKSCSWCDHCVVSRNQKTDWESGTLQMACQEDGRDIEDTSKRPDWCPKEAE